MRKITKNIVGVLSLGVLATSWSVGQAAETGLKLGTGTVTDSAATNTDAATQAPVTTETSAPTEAAASSPAAPTPSSAPTQSATPTPTATKKAASASGSQTGAAVPYKYGTIQLEVVKSGSTITAVNLIQSSTKGPDWAVVPGMLAEAAVAANGSSFGNVSGATFTTQAFKSALESALAKF